MREVCRSKPTFRRGLLFAWVLFIGLFLADLFLVAHLAFSDLSHRVIDEAIRASLDALRPAVLAAPDPILLDAGPIEAVSAEPCPIKGPPQSTDRFAPCDPPAPRPDPGPSIFRALTTRLERVVTDTRGQVLWRGIEQRFGLQVDSAPAAALVEGHSEVREEWDVGNRRQGVIAVRQAAPPGSQQIREVGIPVELIDQQVALLQRDLQKKLWIGAGAAVLILLIAFLYVLRLLHRTRLLEAQAQMDDRLAYVGGLAAGLAHEIRNPLNVLSMNLEMLEEEISGRADGGGGEVRVYLSALQGEIRRLSSLVDNFLSYARPNQTRFETKDLNRILADIALLVRPEFEARGIALRLDLSPVLPPVDLDEAQIRQAVMNILMNAAQVLQAGGTVTVQTAVGSHGEAIASVQDDGPGIKPGDRERIFEVFYSTRGGGTGLGLPIAARIMEAHGGTIDVVSDPGRGARFVLRLPRRHPAEGAPAGGGAVTVPGNT